MNEQTPPTRRSSRLFIALELPPSLQDQINQRCPALRAVSWSQPEQLHLTLAFIGALSEQQMAALDEALLQIQFEPFLLQLDRVGHFNQRTLWLGSELSRPLQLLHDRLQQCLASLGLERDRRPFTPHITLGQIKTGAPGPLLHQLEATLLKHPMMLEVDRFVLKNSILAAPHPIHQMIRLYGATAAAVKAPPVPTPDQP